MQILKKNWLFVSKMIKIWWILTWTLKILKIPTMIGSICTKYISFDLKKHRGVILHALKIDKNFWRKADLWFGKWNGEFGKFSLEHLKVSKLGIWGDSFVIENAWAKNLQGSYV